MLFKVTLPVAIFHDSPMVVEICFIKFQIILFSKFDEAFNEKDLKTSFMTKLFLFELLIEVELLFLKEFLWVLKVKLVLKEIEDSTSMLFN